MNMPYYDPKLQIYKNIKVGSLVKLVSIAKTQFETEEGGFVMLTKHTHPKIQEYLLLAHEQEIRQSWVYRFTDVHGINLTNERDLCKVNSGAIGIVLSKFKVIDDFFQEKEYTSYKLNTSYWLLVGEDKVLAEGSKVVMF